MLNFRDYIEQRLDDEVLQFLAQQGNYSLEKLGVIKDAYKQAYLAYNFGEDIAGRLRKAPARPKNMFTTETIGSMLMDDWNSKAGWQIAKNVRNQPIQGMTPNQQMLKTINDSYNTNKLIPNYTKARKMSDFDSVWGGVNQGVNQGVNHKDAPPTLQQQTQTTNLPGFGNPQAQQPQLQQPLNNLEGFGVEAKKRQGLSNTPIGNPQPQQEVQFGQQPQINNNQQNLVQLLKNIKQKQSGFTSAATPVQQKQPVIQQIQQPFELNATKTSLGQTVQNLGNQIKDGIQKEYNKYEGLTPVAAVQKAASKVPIPLTSREYYGISTHLADGEKQEDKVLRENDFYKLSDITDKEKYDTIAKKIIAARELDPNDPKVYDLIKDTTIVSPKDDANLAKLLRNSTQLEDFVAENYEKLKADMSSKAEKSVEFPKNVFSKKDMNRFATIHRADINNARVNQDGSLSLDWNDYYDYNKWDGISPFVFLNNNANEQQEKDQLMPYMISKTMNLSVEEIEELLKKRKKRLKNWH